MSTLKTRERLEILKLATDARLASARGRIGGLGSRLGRALGRSGDELLFVPSDLRPQDPSLIDEMEAGQMGLAGIAVEIGRRSPFSFHDADPVWIAELHGFSWLGSLRCAGDPQATELARRLVGDWIGRNRRTPGGRGIARRPDVVARRVIAWIVGAGDLLNETDAAFYGSVMHALGAEVDALERLSQRAAPGLPRLGCLMALLLAGLALKGQDRKLRAREQRFVGELDAQLMEDGGHVSRNPEAVLDVLLDLLPIRECYGVRETPVPAAIDRAIDRMLAHARAMTLTEGGLARFNGCGPPRVEVSLLLALQRDGSPATQSRRIGSSGYARLERGSSVVIADCAPPPPLAHGARAHAGALSFEMAADGEALIVNAGAPRHRTGTPAADARASASHSTLVADGASSSRLIRSRSLERLIGGAPIVEPETVTGRLAEIDGAIELTMRHDGYLKRYGLVHERTLTLAAEGDALDGLDRLAGPWGTLRLARDVPFAIHFHLAAGVTARSDGEGRVRIALASGRSWRLSAEGVQVSVESAVSFAQARGTAATLQVVLRGACPGESELRWRLERG